jgi:hypothetical protein
MAGRDNSRAGGCNPMVGSTEILFWVAEWRAAADENSTEQIENKSVFLANLRNMELVQERIGNLSTREDRFSRM